MKRKSLSERSIFTKQITSTVSVTLVIFILGLVGLIAVGTRQMGNMLKSRTGFTIVMTNEATGDEIAALQRRLEREAGVRVQKFTSAEENMSRWNSDMGEDVMQILGVNPFPADIDVRVNAEWGNPDSLVALSSRYSHVAGVSEISLNDSTVANLNHHLTVVTWILTGISLGLLLISFVLINNTVRLTVYSRRFLIHTMKLVGATGSFIRGPFVRSGVMSGLTAGVAGSAVMAALIAYGHSRQPAVTECLPWSGVWWIFPVMILSAIAICSLASAMATNRYLKLDYDELF